MDIKEISERRKLLEAQIYKLLIEFHKETGAHVTSISADIETHYSPSGNRKVGTEILGVYVSTEIF